jgi:hypothetical protein
MSKLYLRGKVQYAPGPWGLALPNSAAKVEITDIDAPGRGDDRIFTATTDQAGRFQGESGEWQDKIRVRIPNPKKPWEMITVEQPDLTDVLVLCAHITEKTPTGTKETKLPFVYVDDSKESPPLVVPWGPPPLAVVARVNEVDCKTPEELYSKIKSAVDAGQTPITIKIYGADAETLRPVTLPPEELRKWIGSRIHLPSSIDLSSSTPKAALTPETSIAIAILCLSVAASIVMVMLGAAVIYALYKGYIPISAKIKTKIGELENEFEVVIGK